MQIIIHRINKIKGLLKIPDEYGVEIDVRAYGRRLILNHEPHKKGEDLEDYLSNCKERFIIFNIKEAGIEDETVSLAQKYHIKDFFLLDVEFPYLYRATREQGFRKIAVRYSEAEPIESALAQQGLADWVWVDINTRLHLDKKTDNLLRKAGFKTCLVCPERWGRPEDVPKYIDYLKKNNIRLDAVMTSLNFAEKWKGLEKSD